MPYSHLIQTPQLTLSLQPFLNGVVIQYLNEITKQGKTSLAHHVTDWTRDTKKDVQETYSEPANHKKRDRALAKIDQAKADVSVVLDQWSTTDINSGRFSSKCVSMSARSSPRMLKLCLAGRWRSSTGRFAHSI